MVGTGTGQPLTLMTRFSDFDTVMAVWRYEPANPPSSQLQFEQCNDDVVAGGDPLASELVLPTQNGKLYYVQIGGCRESGSGPRAAHPCLDTEGARPRTAAR